MALNNADKNSNIKTNILPDDGLRKSPRNYKLEIEQKNNEREGKRVTINLDGNLTSEEFTRPTTRSSMSKSLAQYVPNDYSKAIISSLTSFQEPIKLIGLQPSKKSSTKLNEGFQENMNNQNESPDDDRSKEDHDNSTSENKEKKSVFKRDSDIQRPNWDNIIKDLRTRSSQQSSDADKESESLTSIERKAMKMYQQKKSSKQSKDSTKSSGSNHKIERVLKSRPNQDKITKRSSVLSSTHGNIEEITKIKKERKYKSKQFQEKTFSSDDSSRCCCCENHEHCKKDLHKIRKHRKHGLKNKDSTRSKPIKQGSENVVPGFNLILPLKSSQSSEGYPKSSTSEEISTARESHSGEHMNTEKSRDNLSKEREEMDNSVPHITKKKISTTSRHSFVKENKKYVKAISELVQKSRGSTNATPEVEEQLEPDLPERIRKFRKYNYTKRASQSTSGQRSSEKSRFSLTF